MTATLVIARLSWRRMWRGRGVWVTLALVVLPALVALAQSLGSSLGPERHWQTAAELALRFLVTLGAAVLLADAVGEELEAKTYTYLWSRPVPRSAVLLGKMLAVVPFLVVTAGLSLVLGYLVAMGGADPGAHLGLLGRALAAAALGSVTAACLAVGIGALAVRHPLVATLGYVMLLEQVLTFVPNLKNLSILHHAFVVAGLATATAPDGGPGRAVVSLVAIGAAWLAVGIWRVRSAEYGAASG